MLNRLLESGNNASSFVLSHVSSRLKAIRRAIRHHTQKALFRVIMNHDCIYQVPPQARGGSRVTRKGRTISSSWIWYSRYAVPFLVSSLKSRWGPGLPVTPQFWYLFCSCGLKGSNAFATRFLLPSRVKVTEQSAYSVFKSEGKILQCMVQQLKLKAVLENCSRSICSAHRLPMYLWAL